MMYKRKVVVYTCDDCGAEQMIPVESNEPPFGFIGGGVTEISGAGGDSIPNWFACSEAHIAGAIRNAFKRERER